MSEALWTICYPGGWCSISKDEIPTCLKRLEKNHGNLDGVRVFRPHTDTDPRSLLKEEE